MKRLASDLPEFRRITSRGHDEWLTEHAGDRVPRILVGVSGYEARSVYWMSQALDAFPPGRETHYVILGFPDHRDSLNRRENDAVYKKHGLEPIVPNDQSEDALAAVDAALAGLLDAFPKRPVEVHIDYSSMPRSWYCNIPLRIARTLRADDRVFMWYTPGEYPDADYPTAGVSDFQVFSGWPSLNPAHRTHIVGLGFDRIRSQAVWSVLDPENLVCFYASPGTRADYVERVRRDNRDVLAAANHVFSVDIHDFAYAYSRIAGVGREFHRLGDVVFVPDGPKPLILACSLVPALFADPGILCCHVSRRKPAQFEPVDVKPLGSPIGFSYEMDV